MQTCFNHGDSKYCIHTYRIAYIHTYNYRLTRIYLTAYSFVSKSYTKRTGGDKTDGRKREREED